MAADSYVRNEQDAVLVQTYLRAGVKRAWIEDRLVRVINGAKAKMAEFKDEFKRMGVYILLGDSDVNGKREIYIGQGIIIDRFRRHVSEKDFWNQFVAFISRDRDNDWTTTDTEYLEHVMIQDARRNPDLILQQNDTNMPKVGEAKSHVLEQLFGDIKILLSALNIDVFSLTRMSENEQDIYSMDARGAKADGYFNSESKFVVKKGSYARKGDAPSLIDSYKNIRKQLVDGKILVEDSDTLYKFADDYQFNSLSSAAGVVSGQQMPGPQTWKHKKSGRFYKDIQEEMLR